jgi:hypothetical protein
MNLRNGHDNPNVTSIEEARKRAMEKAKPAKRVSVPGERRPATLRDWIVGGLFIAMAVGAIVSFFYGAAVPMPDGDAK